MDRIPLILAVLAFLLFGLAAFVPPAPMDPYRLRFVAAGLTVWALAYVFGYAFGPMPR
jgi:hypothetical protein